MLLNNKQNHDTRLNYQLYSNVCFKVTLQESEIIREYQVRTSNVVSLKTINQLRINQEINR